MRTIRMASPPLVIVVMLTALCQETATQGNRPLVAADDYKRWQVELSNWGRWGAADELGTLNLITPAKRRAAVALVKDGITVSLASNAMTEKGIDVPCPVQWAMVTASEEGATDQIAYPCIHGAGTTHLDSFEQSCRTGEHAGRKLDFITQEMLREANTIASKANDADIARHIVEIKGSIDRLKEQVQNVE